MCCLCPKYIWHSHLFQLNKMLIFSYFARECRPCWTSAWQLSLAKFTKRFLFVVITLVKSQNSDFACPLCHHIELCSQLVFDENTHLPAAHRQQWDVALTSQYQQCLPCISLKCLSSWNAVLCTCSFVSLFCPQLGVRRFPISSCSDSEHCKISLCRLQFLTWYQSRSIIRLWRIWLARQFPVSTLASFPSNIFQSPLKTRGVSILNFQVPSRFSSLEAHVSTFSKL